MPEDKSYRLYLEEKFEGMQKVQHAYFREVHDSLDTIKELGKIRNNRLEKAEGKIECIENDLQEYRMLKRYPKIAIGIVVFCVLSAIYGFMKITAKQDGLKAQLDMVNTPVQTERGIILIPSGILVDSVANK